MKFHSQNHSCASRTLSVAAVLGLALGTSAAIAATSNFGATRPDPSPSASAQDAPVLAPTAGFDILYAPSGVDDPVFRAAIQAFVSGNVDHFDASAATPDVPTLSGYECVMTYGDYPYADAAGFGNNLAAYVDAGGSVVLGTFANNPGFNTLGGAITGPAYAPAIGNGSNSLGASSNYAGDGVTEIHTGVAAYSANFIDVLALQGTGIQDGSFLSGEIAVAYRPDYAVVSANGTGGIPDVLTDGQWEGNDPDWPRLIANACQARSNNETGGDVFEKELTSGPDVDLDEAVDVVVPAKPEVSQEYDFTIHWSNETYPDVLIVDTLPAQWVAVQIEGFDIGLGDGGPGIDECGESDSLADYFGMVDIYKNGKGKKCQSSTTIEWMPPSGEDASLRVDANTRPSPGKGHGKRGKPPAFAPTSCGPLYLNEGAVALEKDEFGDLVLDLEGNPVVVAGPTNALCLVAVDQDLLDALPEYDADADHDADGLASHAEACGEIGTDPCDPDTDGDGVLDGADACPLEGPPNPNLGELQDPDGCSDGIDNELDGTTDFVGGDLSCDDILDDSEDTYDGA
jgi:hypothetical protein